MTNGVRPQFDVSIEEHPGKRGDAGLAQIQGVGLSGGVGLDDPDRIVDAPGDLRGPVGAGVDHHHDLEIGNATRQHATEGALDHGCFIVGWNDDAGHVS